MHDEFTAPVPGEPIDPVAMARRDMKKALPKRFYETVTTAAQDAGFAILLDGRSVKTPAKNALVLPNEALAEAVAVEWRAQEHYIDPDTMPLTKLVHSALDGVAGMQQECIDEIVRYSGTDLVCYRAGEPDALVELQAQAWDPYLAFARDSFGARFICTQGIMFSEQPDAAISALRAALQALIASDTTNLKNIRLAALNVMTSLTGSAIIALAVAHGAHDAASAWKAVHVDEDFQMQIWGQDEEALIRRTTRWTDMEAAAKLFQLVR